MGKNFSCNNVAGKRKKSDFYETPYSLTRLLLDVVTLAGSVLEPACGAGAIVKVLQEYGYTSTFYDAETDFLKETRHFKTIITNPPFSLALQFIQTAKRVCDQFFFLLPLAYLHGKERYDVVYTDRSFPLRTTFVFTRYPMLGDPLREDGKHRTGMMVYSWFWFDRTYTGPPTIQWLDNHPTLSNPNMIKFTEIRYRNIMSVGNAWITIPLAAHPQTLIVGSNGSGKTILLEALNFALFGKPYRNFNKPQLVNTTNGRELEVELTFEVHGHTYMVRRGIKPNLFEIHRDGVKLDEDPDSRDQQDFLERTILKFNEKAFRQTIVLGSSAFVPFMRLPAAARREVIEDLLDIEVFSVMNDILKKQMSDTKKLLDNIQMRQKLMEERERLAAQYEQSLKEDQAARLKQIADERVQAQEHVQFCRNELTRLQAQFDADNDELKKFDKVVSRIGKAETAMRQVKDRMDAISKQLQFFRAHEHCPTCTQTLTEDFRTETIQNLSVQQMEQATTLKKLETLMVKLRADDVLRVQCVRKLDGVKNTMRQTQLVMAQSEAVLHSLTSQEAKVVKPVSKNFAPVTDDEKVALQQELTNTLFTQHVQNMASGLLKDSGIKTQIIDHYLPIINHLINKHLSALNFPIQFMLDAQFKETVLSRNRDTFSYESFSDGQKKRIDLAMMMTWRAVAQLRNSAYTNLLILDEVCDSSLDADGVEEFLKMLHGLEGTNTVVISHKTDQMIDKFPNVIRVAMSRGFTVVEEGATTVAA